MSFIECPYCGYEHDEDEFKNAWELYELGEDEEREVVCDNCDKKFFTTPCITIEYVARKVEDKSYR